MSSRSARFRFLALASALVLGLASCQTTPRHKQTPPEPPPAPPAAEAAPGARELGVVPAESLLQVFVYRGGKMARLGHNHVIASHTLAGKVWLARDIERTRFDISFNVADLTIDEPELRAQAGEDFPPGVPQSARDGTRRNMLSEALLDAGRFPDIRLRATDVVARGEDYDVGVEVTIKGQTHIVRVPMRIVQSDGALTARGEFPLKQSELGLTPFTVMMGALAVLDDMRVRVEVVAR